MPRRLGFALQLLFTIAVCGFLILPVLLSMEAGISLNATRGLSAGLTTRWLLQVWDIYADTIFRSLGIALACLVVDILLAVPAAYVLVRRPGRWARVIEELIVLPVAVPGLATALGLLLVYGSLSGFRSSDGFILVGHVLFTLPFMLRAVIAVLAGIDLATLEEAAAGLGAGPLRRFLSVGVPNARAGMLAGALMVVTLSVGEFNLTWMLHTPLTKTLPVGLADAYASMRLEVGSAYTIIFLAMILPLLIGLQWAARWRPPSFRNGALPRPEETT